MSETAHRADALHGPWSPLRIRVFRALWIAGLVSNVGTFMHIAAAGWAMTSLTTAPTTVSLVQTAWTVPGFLLALHAGALADVVDRRRLIVATQLAALAVAGALGVLEATGQLTVGLLLAGTFLLSVALTLAAPAFMALTPELVGSTVLPQAIGLDSISRNVAQSVGPATAGVLIALAGPGAVFLVNAASFVGIVFVVRAYRPAPDATRSRPQPEPIGAAIRSGLRYIRDTPRLQRLAGRLVLTWAFTVSLTALLPLAARTRLHTTAGQYGLLWAALGVGAVLAVWVLPHCNAAARPDAVALVAAAMWSLGAGLFAVTGMLAIALAGLVVAGAGAMATLNLLFSTYTLLLPTWVRGRASSVAMLTVWLGASAGAFAWGAVAAATGVRDALLLAAVVNLAGTAAATVVLRITTAADLAAPAAATASAAATATAPATSDTGGR